MLEELLEAWRTNQRINLYLIDQISDEGMASTLSTRGGRTVLGQFAHIHNIRLAQLDGRTNDLALPLEKIAAKNLPDREALRQHLEASSTQIEEFLRRCVEGGQVRGFKKGVITALGYLISHESHHRGSILLTLKQSGHKLDKKASYAIWDWDRI